MNRDTARTSPTRSRAPLRVHQEIRRLEEEIARQREDEESE